MLIAGIIQDDAQRVLGEQGAQFEQQVADRVSIDVAIVADRYQLVANSIQSPQNVEALSTTGRFDEDPSEAPQKAQERLQHKMSGINKKEATLALLGLC